MIGILVLLILGSWVFVAIWLTKICVKNSNFSKVKGLAYPFVCVFIFIFPVADDIAGGFQFRAMCTKDNILIYDPLQIEGKTVTTEGSKVEIINKIVPISILTREWFEEGTGELLITHKIFTARGGWLSRMLGYPEGPYTFYRTCDFKEYYSLFSDFNVTKIEN